MEKTPNGTTVGVDDPYAYVDRCDHLTDDGRCRYAVEHPDADPAFARDRRAAEYQCLAAPAEAMSTDADSPEWDACPHFRCRNHDRACTRCGLEERRDAHGETRPLLEEHHLSYASTPESDADRLSHEITVYLCRWCHAKIHNSWARIDDDVSPDQDAIAAREARRSREQAELSFESAGERYDEE